MYLSDELLNFINSSEKRCDIDDTQYFKEQTDYDDIIELNAIYHINNKKISYQKIVGYFDTITQNFIYCNSTFNKKECKIEDSDVKIYAKKIKEIADIVIKIDKNNFVPDILNNRTFVIESLSLYRNDHLFFDEKFDHIFKNKTYFFQLYNKDKEKLIKKCIYRLNSNKYKNVIESYKYMFDLFDKKIENSKYIDIKNILLNKIDLINDIKITYNFPCPEDNLKPTQTLYNNLLFANKEDLKYEIIFEETAYGIPLCLISEIEFNQNEQYKFGIEKNEKITNFAWIKSGHISDINIKLLEDEDFLKKVVKENVEILSRLPSEKLDDRNFWYSMFLENSRAIIYLDKTWLLDECFYKDIINNIDERDDLLYMFEISKSVSEESWEILIDKYIKNFPDELEFMFSSMPEHIINSKLLEQKLENYECINIGVFSADKIKNANILFKLYSNKNIIKLFHKFNDDIRINKDVIHKLAQSPIGNEINFLYKNIDLVDKFKNDEDALCDLFNLATPSDIDFCKEQKSLKDLNTDVKYLLANLNTYCTELLNNYELYIYLSGTLLNFDTIEKYNNDIKIMIDNSLFIIDIRDKQIWTDDGKGRLNIFYDIEKFDDILTDIQMEIMARNPQIEFRNIFDMIEEYNNLQTKQIDEPR